MNLNTINFKCKILKKYKSKFNVQNAYLKTFIVKKKSLHIL